MAKAKKVEKRSAPKKAAKKVKYVCKECREGRCSVHGSPKKPSKLVKLTKPELAEESKKQKTTVLRGVKFETRYPERVPEKPPEPEQPKMEISVRNIYMAGTGFVPSLCFRKPGALHIPCVAGDPVNGVRKFTVPATQHDKSPVVQHGYGNFSAPYDPRRFAEHMRTIAAAAPITPEARTLLLPYVPDMPAGPAALPGAIGASPGTESTPVPRRIASGSGSRATAGPGRTSGKELIRTLADASGLPPEKIRAKLRAAGMRAPYTDEAACRKALDLNGPTKIPEPRRKKA